MNAIAVHTRQVSTDVPAHVAGANGAQPATAAQAFDPILSLFQSLGLPGPFDRETVPVAGANTDATGGETVTEDGTGAAAARLMQGLTGRGAETAWMGGEFPRPAGKKSGAAQDGQDTLAAGEAAAAILGMTRANTAAPVPSAEAANASAALAGVTLDRQAPNPAPSAQDAAAQGATPALQEWNVKDLGIGVHQALQSALGDKLAQAGTIVSGELPPARPETVAAPVMGEQDPALAAGAQSGKTGAAIPAESPILQADASGDAPDDPLQAAAVKDGSAAHHWVARPVEDANGSSRMPGIIEQVRQVADFLAERTEGAVSLTDKGVEARLRLYPPDLGGVRVQMSVSSAGVVQASFTAEQPATAQLLQQHVNQFREALNAQGLAVDRIQIAVQGTSTTFTGSGQSGSNPEQRPDFSANQQRRQERQDSQSSFERQRQKQQDEAA
jgi:flagellar hook-length control protein FliK